MRELNTVDCKRGFLTVYPGRIKALNFENFDNSQNRFLWPEYVIVFMWKMDLMSGCDIRLVFTLPPRDSTLHYKRCVHLWNKFPCIIALTLCDNLQLLKKNTVWSYFSVKTIWLHNCLADKGLTDTFFTGFKEKWKSEYLWFKVFVYLSTNLFLNYKMTNWSENWSKRCIRFLPILMLVHYSHCSGEKNLIFLSNFHWN